MIAQEYLHPLHVGPSVWLPTSLYSIHKGFKCTEKCLQGYLRYY